MKKIFLMLGIVCCLCGFSDLSGRAAGGLQVEANNSDWQVSMRGNSAIRAYNPSSQVEVVVNVADILPSSPLCVSNKRIKDIKMTLNIYKIAAAGDDNWAKAFEKTRINFSRPGESAERKIYGSTLIKNNLKFPAGTVVNIGTLEFLAPFVCGDVNNTTMRISGMKAGYRALPPLDFTLLLEQ